jgi:DNA-binding transcriptional regulator GbsR (MarR family)
VRVQFVQKNLNNSFNIVLYKIVVNVSNNPSYNKSLILKLDDWETAIIDLFLNAANSFGLPKSYGQIYGLLFCRDQSLALGEVMEILQISKGSASQGLRALRQLGAVSTVFEPGDRKERFVAEIRLRKLVGGFLREQADPHLDKGVSRLKQIETLLGNLDDSDSLQRGVRRHEILLGWHRQMSRLLPWVKMVVGKSDRLPKKSSD